VSVIGIIPALEKTVCIGNILVSSGPFQASPAGAICPVAKVVKKLVMAMEFL
jgi:hypothetical protein